MNEETQFQDFTRENYRKIIQLAKNRFVYRTFSDFSKNERFVLWRHDLDFSVHAARRLAQIEAQEGVVATYFLHLHSQFYNLFEPTIVKLIKEILGLGHRIGLHFDTHFYAIDQDQALEKYLKFEKSVLENMFAAPIGVFSFHNTDRFTDSCRAWEYAEMINAYAEYFRSEVKYVSDSNGYWRHGRLEDVLNDAEHHRLQVLTHPEWWQDVPMSPRARIERCIKGRADATGREYDLSLASAGRRNIRG